MGSASLAARISASTASAGRLRSITRARVRPRRIGLLYERVQEAGATSFCPKGVASRSPRRPAAGHPASRSKRSTQPACSRRSVLGDSHVAACRRLGGHPHSKVRACQTTTYNFTFLASNRASMLLQVAEQSAPWASTACRGHVYTYLSSSAPGSKTPPSRSPHRTGVRTIARCSPPTHRPGIDQPSCQLSVFSTSSASVSSVAIPAECGDGGTDRVRS